MDQQNSMKYLSVQSSDYFASSVCLHVYTFVCTVDISTLVWYLTYNIQVYHLNKYTRSTVEQSHRQLTPKTSVMIVYTVVIVMYTLMIHLNWSNTANRTTTNMLCLLTQEEMSCGSLSRHHQRRPFQIGVCMLLCVFVYMCMCVCVCMCTPYDHTHLQH